MARPPIRLSCSKQVLGWIPWYADGGLTDRQMSAVDAHASRCPECRAELDLVAGAAFEIEVDLPDPDRSFAEVAARIAEWRRGESSRRGPDRSPDRAMDSETIGRSRVTDRAGSLVPCCPTGVKKNVD